MGKLRTLPAEFEMWMVKLSRSLPSIAHTLAVRCAGSRNRTSSCVRAMAALTIKMVPALLGLRLADSSHTTTELTMESSSSKLAKCQQPGIQPRVCQARGGHARDPQSRRVARSTAQAWRDDSRNRRASRAARDRKLVLCIRQRCANVFHSPDRHWDSSCSHLCSFGRRGLEQPSDSQSRYLVRLVHSRIAWMGLKFHGCDRPDPHGAGFSVRSLQVSARVDLDDRRIPATDDAGDGF